MPGDRTGTTRDDGDLEQRVRVPQEPARNRVARLVVGNGLRKKKKTILSVKT